MGGIRKEGDKYLMLDVVKKNSTSIIQWKLILNILEVALLTYYYWLHCSPTTIMFKNQLPMNYRS